MLVLKKSIQALFDVAWCMKQQQHSKSCNILKQLFSSYN